MKTIKKILFLLSTKERKNLLIIMGMLMITGFLDMLGVASILPFMGVLSNPEIVETNVYLNFLFKSSGLIGIENTKHFLFALGVLVFILLVVSLGFKVFTGYVKSHFVQMRNYSISKKLVEGYLHQPYSWFLNRNSAHISKTILSEVAVVVNKSLAPLVELMAQCSIVFMMLALLIIVNPKLTFVVGATLILAYLIIYLFNRNILKRIGVDRLEANKLRFDTLSEAFGAAKEIKVGAIEQFYIKRFTLPAELFSRLMARSQVIRLLPRFILEAIAFGGMLLVVLYLMKQSVSFVDVLPIIVLYAYAGYRLMPALQSIFANFTSLRFSNPALDDLYKDIKNLKSYNLNDSQNLLELKKSIKLNQVHYNYPNSSKMVLKNIDIDIPAKSNVAFVGATGSGKTTLVDIIIGLLDPQKGTLEVDDKLINKDNSRAWQRSIGYVPQNTFLADNTILANIAFGIKEKDINHEAVKFAAQIASLHDFIVSELPMQYQTNVGERGVKLSGGQIQRIGIARAFYHNPQVIVLDEATNALDRQTEKMIMDAIEKNKKNVTIIMIAHQLNTVKNCDTIFLLEKGELKAKGSYEELSKFSDYFSQDTGTDKK